MSRLLAILLTLHLLVCAAAQERYAVVRLEDGSELRGTVVLMDIEQLQLRTTEGVVKIPAVRIRKCTIESAEEQSQDPRAPEKPSERAPAQEPVNAPVTAPEPAPAPAGEVAPKVAPAGSGATASRSPQSPAGASVDRQQEPELDAVVGPTLRQRTYWKPRLAVFSERFPWFVPADPTQWISIGLLLFACLSLSVYSSTRLASGEPQEFARAMVLSVWFLVTGALQVAFVPANDLSAVIMLLVNPAFALLWLRVLFGLSRSAALVAFTIQLGFVVVGYGVIELLDSILRSINAPIG